MVPGTVNADQRCLFSEVVSVAGNHNLGSKMTLPTFTSHPIAATMVAFF